MTPDMKDLILFSIEVFQAMLTPVIGITTAYIAWQQYRIAREKARVERYDRRVKIFKETMLFIGCAKTKGNISDEQLHSLLRKRQRLNFFSERTFRDLSPRSTKMESSFNLLIVNSNRLEGRSPEILGLTWQTNGKKC
jgi:hypothetical protein